jgi:hypothetical protein
VITPILTATSLWCFDSYESAMANSSLPETKASAEQYMKVSDGPPVFHDLDILEDWA